MGRGGRRINAGRKRKSEVERQLDGGAGHRAKVLPHPSAPLESSALVLPSLDETDAPDDLTLEERQVWLELAPYAMAAGTLIPSTGLAFRRLCRNVALEKRYAISVLDAGGPNHRGLIQRVDTELLGFNLAPSGRRPATEAPAIDPLEAKYLGDSRQSA